MPRRLDWKVSSHAFCCSVKPLWHIMIGVAGIMYTAKYVAYGCK